ncbi:MAG: TIGR02206 family membrane protein [Candidatus Izimaplasma sp.]|nr:TIGR02206 family membrane protein [Candidatus Izimaplasma bacterium]
MTFEKFFGHDINFSRAVKLLTIHHLLLSLVALGSIILTLKIADKIKTSSKEQRIKYIFIGILVFLELTYHIHNWTYPRISVPLHVCSFAVFLNITLLLTDSKKVWNYAIFFGTLGGIMALIIPNSYGYTYYNFRYYHFIIIHSVILSIPLYYYKAYNFRVDYKTTIEIFKNTVILGIVIYIANGLFHLADDYYNLNGFLDTNYWFINKIPDNVSSTFHNWSIYIICYVSLVFLTMNILYYVSNYATIFKKKSLK